MWCVCLITAYGLLYIFQNQTPLEWGYIWGIQGRYFTPVLVLFMYSLSAKGSFDQNEKISLINLNMFLNTCMLFELFFLRTLLQEVVNLEYLIFILGSLIACVIAFVVNKTKIFNFMNRIKKDIFGYIIEFVLSVVSLVLLFQCFILYHYWHNFNVILYVLLLFIILYSERINIDKLIIHKTYKITLKLCQ